MGFFFLYLFQKGRSELVYVRALDLFNGVRSQKITASWYKTTLHALVLRIHIAAYAVRDTNKWKKIRKINHINVFLK